VRDFRFGLGSVWLDQIDANGATWLVGWVLLNQHIRSAYALYIYTLIQITPIFDGIPLTNIMQPPLDPHPLIDIVCLHEVAACTTVGPDNKTIFFSKKELRYESDSCYDGLLLIQSHTQGSHLCNQHDARQNRTGMQLGGKNITPYVTDRHK
jgi:hypothetical protein